MFTHLKTIITTLTTTHPLSQKTKQAQTIKIQSKSIQNQQVNNLQNINTLQITHQNHNQNQNYNIITLKLNPPKTK